MIPHMGHCGRLCIRITIKALWACIIATPLSAFVPGFPGNLAGFVLGVFFCVLNLFLLARTLEKAAAMEPTKATLYTFFCYMVRYMLTGALLALSIQFPGINVLYTVLGLFLIKLIILANNIGCGTG